jgi:hypothetical protein
MYFYSFRQITLCALLGIGISPLCGRAEEPPASFLPSWRLLSPSQKQDFVAGYMLGWSDAAKVTDVVIGYVKDHPHESISGLQRIKQIYDFGGISPAEAVSGLDRFYARPENREAPFSQAISAMKSDR